MIANAFYSLIIALSIATVATVRNDNRGKGLKKLFKYYIGLICVAIITGTFLSTILLRLFNPQLVDLAKSFLQLLLYSSIIIALYQF